MTTTDGGSDLDQIIEPELFSLIFTWKYEIISVFKKLGPSFQQVNDRKPSGQRQESVFAYTPCLAVSQAGKTMLKEFLFAEKGKILKHSGCVL